MNRAFAGLFFMIIANATKGQDLQAYADSMRVAHQIPEIGYAVVSPDRIVDIKAVGYHRDDRQTVQTKATLADYFHLGSNAKAITGFVAAQLVESKKINWTTKLFDLFPDWKATSHPAYADVTLQDLLSHRARVRPYTSGLEYKMLPPFEGDKAERRKQFSKYILQQEPVPLNDKEFNYSNAGYSVAAAMLEKVTGKSWEQLIKELLETRLKINVAFGWPNRISQQQPFGHWMVNNTLKAVLPDVDYDLALAEPAGDISMSLPDYARFIQLNLLGLSGKDTILKASTYQFLHFGLKGYSIGWGNVSKDSLLLSEHAGSAGTFFCYTLNDYKQQLAFIIMANAATPQTQQAVFKLLDQLRRTYKDKRQQ